MTNYILLLAYKLFSDFLWGALILGEPGPLLRLFWKASIGIIDIIPIVLSKLYPPGMLVNCKYLIANIVNFCKLQKRVLSARNSLNNVTKKYQV